MKTNEHVQNVTSLNDKITTKQIKKTAYKKILILQKSLQNQLMLEI